MEQITFNEIPAAIMALNRKVDLLLSRTSENVPDEDDKLLTIEELINYLPEHPARQTVYGKINNRTIPYEKYGRRLYFRKSIIDKWLSSGRQMKGL